MFITSQRKPYSVSTNLLKITMFILRFMLATIL